MNPFQLEGQHILIAGASGGLGRAIATLASQMGARLTIAGRNTDELEITLKSLDGDGHQVEAIDFAETEDLAAWLTHVAARHGSLQGLVQAAGIQVVKPLRVMNSKFINEILNVNLTVNLELARGFRQKSVCPRGGSLVLISSVMGLVGQAGQIAYSASKGALVSACRSLALELARDKIRVNCIAPGLVETAMANRLKGTLSEEQYAVICGMHPLGLGSPEDVAAAAVYLLSPAARWVTGTAMVVDGGYTAH